MENDKQETIVNSALIEKIDELSKSLGYNEEENTIFELRQTDDPKIKELVLMNGEWDENRPMFVVDKAHPEKALVFFSMEQIAALLKTLQATTQENFNLKLEKAIWKHTPVDFQDVWVVAMDEIQKRIKALQEKGEPLKINLDDIVARIKREHPSLFIDLNRVTQNIHEGVMSDKKTQ